MSAIAEIVIFFAVLIVCVAGIFRICEEGDYNDFD